MTECSCFKKELESRLNAGNASKAQKYVCQSF